MKLDVQYKTNALRRVQSLAEERGDQLVALKDSESRKLLDASIAQLDAHDKDQSSTNLELDGQSNLQKSLEVDLRTMHMQPIADFARAKLVGVPDFASLTRGTSGLNGHGLVRAARAMATAAAPYTDRFTAGGFPADTIAQLDAAAEQLNGVLDQLANLKVRRAGFTQGMVDQAKQGREAVKMLSAVVQRHYAKDKTFLAAWRLAKRVVTKPGLPRGAAAAAEATNSVAPVAAVTQAAAVTPVVPVTPAVPVAHPTA